MMRLQFFAVVTLIVFLLSTTARCRADLVLTVVGTAATEDFDGFTGAGFSPTPTAGQLDSNTFRLLGMSDGDLGFGGTGTTGDYARGFSTGGVTTGGVYAFDVGGGNIAAGVQPGGSDFTPGSLTVRIRNDTGETLSGLDVSALGYYLNNEERAQRVTISGSFDDVNYLDVFSYETPEASDALGWQTEVIGERFNVPILNGQQFFLRIASDDLSGSGSRDELAIDALSITGFTAIPEPGSAAFLLAVGGLVSFGRRRGRA
ncbi:MAG: hypothetical protein AAFV88_15595 [Planctomycetota bacterium]